MTNSPKSEPTFLKVPSDPRYLKQIREEVSRVAKEAGFDEEWRGRIVLAIDEAITNIIRHTYNRETDKEIHISLLNDEKALRITLRDFGTKPDLNKISSRDLKDVRPGGLGCHFIKEIMDEVTYDIDSNEIGTELRLIKYKKS